MSDKICLVTGGTRGIGAAISILLAKNNFKVIANYASNDQKANEFAKANNIKVKKFDVSNYEDCKEKINSII